MKSFLLRGSGFLLVCTALLWLLTAFTDMRLRERQTGRLKAWNDMAEGKINADLLIMGSSHAHVQVDPRLLQALFPGMRLYNAGLDGYTFPVQQARYQLYRQHNQKPRIILLCLDYIELGKSEFKIDPLQFLPFLNYPSMRQALLGMGVSRPRVWLPFLKYQGEAKAVLAAFRPQTALPGDQFHSLVNGFMPIYQHWNEAKFRADTLPTHPRITFDSSIWQNFQGFRKVCREEGITLVTLFTPHQSRYLNKLKQGASYRAWLRSQLEPQTPFLDFSEASFCADTSLFYSATHLNARGAEVFTKALADSLQRRGIALTH